MTPVFAILRGGWPSGGGALWTLRGGGGIARGGCVLPFLDPGTPIGGGLALGGGGGGGGRALFELEGPRGRGGGGGGLLFGIDGVTV